MRSMGTAAPGTAWTCATGRAWSFERVPSSPLAKHPARAGRILHRSGSLLLEAVQGGGGGVANFLLRVVRPRRRSERNDGPRVADLAQGERGGDADVL